MLLAQEAVSGSNSQVLWTLGDHQHSIRDYVAYDGSSVLAEVEYNALGERVLDSTPAIVDALFAFPGTHRQTRQPPIARFLFTYSAVML